MSLTTALVIVLGAVAVLNLFLTVGVIRRLREHTDLLTKKIKLESPKVMAKTGERVEAFSGVTVDGQVITDESFTQGSTTLVGVFAHGCSSCEERRPAFVRFARSFPGGRDRVLAIMVGEEEHLEGMRTMLEPVARVMTEERPGGTLTSAFKVKGYPAFAIINPDGTVRTSGAAMEDLNLTPELAGV